MKARGLFAAIVILNLASVYMAVLFNDWYGRFYDALQETKEAVFWTEIGTFTYLAFAAIIVAAYRFYLTQLLEMNWRQWMTIVYEQEGFHHATADIEVLLHGQSAHIAQGVDEASGKEEGAGDQGIMFGYATNETSEFMPAPIHFSHKILKKLAEVRHSGKEAWLGPDAKSQVTVRYENGKPVEATSIVLSTQHLDGFIDFIRYC